MPNLVGADDFHALQEIGLYLVLRMFLARIRRLIDRNKPHQPAYAVTATSMAASLHIPRYLPRAISRRLKELLVDDFHKPQILGALAKRRVIKRRAPQIEELALLANAEFVTGFSHFFASFPEQLNRGFG